MRTGVRVAVVIRDSHACWLRDVEDAYATDDGGPEALEAPTYVASAADETAAIEEALEAIVRVPRARQPDLHIDRHGRHEGADGAPVLVVTVVSDSLLDPDPTYGLERVEFDVALSLLGDVQDDATVVGLRAFDLDELRTPEPVWETRQATILEREGRVDGRAAYLGRFDAGPWGELEKPIEDAPLAEALEWSRTYAAHVVLYLGDGRFEAGALPSPNRYPAWDGTVPPRPGVG